MNKRSRGFTLAELLMALVIHSFFILMLGGTFYTLISFGSRSQMVMTARERGQRVINFIDSRVRNAGLGMWKLESSKEFREALAPLVNGSTAKKGFNNSDAKNITLPVIITYDYQDSIAEDGLYGDVIKSEDNILRGNVLTLLYAQHADDKNFTLKNGGYAIMIKDELNGLPSNVKQLKEKIFQPIQNKIYEYYANNIYDGDLKKIPIDIKKEVDDEAFNNFWAQFLSEGIKNAKKSFDSATESAYETEYSNSSQSGYKAVVAATLDVISGDTDVAWQSLLKDLLQYVNTKKNIFIPQVTSTLKPYSTFNSEFTHEFLSGKDEYTSSDFSEKGGNNNKGVINNLRSYAVLRGTGSPIIVNKDSLNLISCEPVLSGDELLYLKSVRVYATTPSDYDKTHGQQERNMKIQKLDGVQWGAANPYQNGILEIYAELDTKNSVLTVWVLSSGGRDNTTHFKPAEWPGRWREVNDTNDYKYYVTYVSKGTWKLNNLHKDRSGKIYFNWN